jgi:hypothetical protein
MGGSVMLHEELPVRSKNRAEVPTRVERGEVTACAPLAPHQLGCPCDSSHLPPIHQSPPPNLPSHVFQQRPGQRRGQPPA